MHLKQGGVWHVMFVHFFSLFFICYTLKMIKKNFIVCVNFLFWGANEKGNLSVQITYHNSWKGPGVLSDSYMSLKKEETNIKSNFPQCLYSMYDNHS